MLEPLEPDELLKLYSLAGEVDVLASGKQFMEPLRIARPAEQPDRVDGIHCAVVISSCVHAD